YGQVDVDNYNYFLTRTYAKNADLKAQRTTLHAELGIKFLFKLFFISYEKVFASTDGIKLDGGTMGDGITWKTGQYTQLENWMKKTNFPMAIPGFNATGGAGNTPLALSDSASYSLRDDSSDMPGMTQVASDYSMESRDYLDKYLRYWGDSGVALMSLDADNKLKNLQMNAYPYADPVVTRDGEWLAYISDQDSTDLNNTRACFTKKQADGSYYISINEEGVVPSKEFPNDITQEPSGVNSGADSNIVMDGNGQFAAAAWIRQAYEMAESGSTPSSQDMTSMMNGSEIYASVLTDAENGIWTTTRLTDNGTPDLSPVVAAGNGKAIVAWRMTAGSSAYMGEDGIPVIKYDDRADSICYRIYKDGNWGEVKTLYMGDLGKVKSLSASIMKDGTIAVAYTIDTDTAGELGNGMGYESAVNIIGIDGNAGDMIRLTSNDALDQGIQVATVTFPDGEERFVTAWYYGESDASGSTTTDIHFLALKKDGSCETDFVDALSDISATTGAAVTEKFAFAKGDNLTLDNLTLLWSEPILAYDEEYGSEAQADGLKAVKFCYETVSDTDKRI
ncbi:MAG: hypothetical protein ACI4R6_00025, partial [Lachnospiraceae bacterium]